VSVKLEFLGTAICVTVKAISGGWFSPGGATPSSSEHAANSDDAAAIEKTTNRLLIIQIHGFIDGPRGWRVGSDGTVHGGDEQNQMFFQ
jgi:hypothetical protein